MSLGLPEPPGTRDLIDSDTQPSHHIPYLYALADAASKTQERVREIAKINYNASVNGLSGVSLTRSQSFFRVVSVGILG